MSDKPTTAELITMLSEFDCHTDVQKLASDRLEAAALPKWTKITDVGDIPKDECRFMWAWQGAGGQWVASVGVNAGDYYLAEGVIDALYSRPLCDLDYPPEQAT